LLRFFGVRQRVFASWPRIFHLKGHGAERKLSPNLKAVVNSKRTLDSATGAMAVLAEHLLPVRQVSRKFGGRKFSLGCGSSRRSSYVVVDAVVSRYVWTLQC
jgi:hypothetical protein